MSKNLITTPVGRSEWMNIFKADYKFDDAGLFGGKLHFDNTEAQGLMKQLDDLLEQSLEKAAEETGKPANKLRTNPPYEVDDETGDVTIKVKLKETVNGRNGSFTQKPKVFDSQQAPIAKEIPLWNGSRLRVSVTPVLYYTAMAGAGVSLRLYAAQIIEALSSSDAADTTLFDKVDDGFTVDSQLAVEKEPGGVKATRDTGEEFDDVPF